MYLSESEHESRYELCFVFRVSCGLCESVSDMSE